MRWVREYVSASFLYNKVQNIKVSKNNSFRCNKCYFKKLKDNPNACIDISNLNN